MRYMAFGLAVVYSTYIYTPNGSEFCLEYFTAAGGRRVSASCVSSLYL